MLTRCVDWRNAVQHFLARLSVFRPVFLLHNVVDTRRSHLFVQVPLWLAEQTICLRIADVEEGVFRCGWRSRKRFEFPVDNMKSVNRNTTTIFHRDTTGTNNVTRLFASRNGKGQRPNASSEQTFRSYIHVIYLKGNSRENAVKLSDHVPFPEHLVECDLISD